MEARLEKLFLRMGKDLHALEWFLKFAAYSEKEARRPLYIAG